MASILVIDDDQQIQNVLFKFLTFSGYDVISASDGQEGLKLYKENFSELVITDIIMPQKEGLETIIKLKQINPNVKIIAISGGGYNVAEDYLPLAEQFGAQKTIAKPFQMQEILDAVKELIG